MAQTADSVSSTTPRPTLSDVARAAGLSQSTISLALNRRPEDCHLTEETRRRAIAAARKLGYRPNWRARALAKGQTYTIGFVYAREAPLITGVNEQILDTLTDTLHGYGYHQLLVPLIGQPNLWRDVIRPDRLDGCIVLHPLPVQLGQILAETGLPMVAINLLSDLPIPQVLPDDTGGMRQVMQHLFALGHRDIAFFYSSIHQHFSVDQRSQAYATALREAGLGDRVRIYAQTTAEECLAICLRSQPRPTAMIPYDHVSAINLLHECWRQGIRVPQDMSVVTFNDVYPTPFTIPPLTTVALPGREMGRMAAELLVRHIDQKSKDGSLPQAPTQHYLPEQLVVRASTAAPPKS